MQTEREGGQKIQNICGRRIWNLHAFCERDMARGGIFIRAETSRCGGREEKFMWETLETRSFSIYCVFRGAWLLVLRDTAITGTTSNMTANVSDTILGIRHLHRMFGAEFLSVNKSLSPTIISIFHPKTLS